MSGLQARLLTAHEANDGFALVDLYLEAAQAAATEDEIGFFLTHAYVFALETGHAQAPALRARLEQMGRECGCPVQPPSPSGTQTSR